MKEAPDLSLQFYPALLHMQYSALLVLLLLEAWDLLLEFCVYTQFAQKRRRLAQKVAQTEQLWFSSVCGYLRIVDTPSYFITASKSLCAYDRLPHRDIKRHT